MRTSAFLAVAISSALAWTSTAGAQVMAQPTMQVVSPEEGVVESACQVLDQIMAIPARAIPATLLADAEGIAIVPGMLKGGFVIGVRHGRGVVVMRDEFGGWTAPLFITITGGSIGWQAGVQATDVVLVFKTKNSIRGLTQGKFTIGGDIAAAAGPVGRQAQAATDASLKAEIYSYSRSRGLFAGLALDGAAIQIDRLSTAAYYATVGDVVPAGEPQPLPPSAQRLLQQVARYTTPEVIVAPGPVIEAEFLPEAGPPIPEFPAPKAQLAESSRRLASLLDENWKSYLALPAEVYLPQSQPSSQAMAQALSRFERVATNPQYQSLAQRPEFQETYALLRQWAATPASPKLQLPPPPAAGN